MKDATGELSMTAVAVVAIAAISVVFSTLIWPTIKANITRSTYCSQSFNCTACANGMCECQYMDSDGETQEVQCPENNTNGGGGAGGVKVFELR